MNKTTTHNTNVEKSINLQRFLLTKLITTRLGFFASWTRVFSSFDSFELDGVVRVCDGWEKWGVGKKNCEFFNSDWRWRVIFCKFEPVKSSRTIWKLNLCNLHIETRFIINYRFYPQICSKIGLFNSLGPSQRSHPPKYPNKVKTLLHQKDQSNYVLQSLPQVSISLPCGRQYLLVNWSKEPARDYNICLTGY